MSKLGAEMNLINESDAIVVLLWVDFEMILNYLPKKALIKHFSTDKMTANEWKTYDKLRIIDFIFREYQGQLERLYRDGDYEKI